MSNNFAGIMSFEQMLDTLTVTPYFHDEEMGFNYSESFFGRDKNDSIISISRDGEETCYVRLPNRIRHDRVSIASVRLLLREHGIDIAHSTWDREGQQNIIQGDEEGYVYILQMQESNLYKIGRTKHYRSRLRLLGVLMPKPCEFVGVWQTKYMRTLETDLHRDYAVHHSNGEWFALPDITKALRYLDATQKRVV